MTDFFIHIVLDFVLGGVLMKKKGGKKMNAIATKIISLDFDKKAIKIPAKKKTNIYEDAWRELDSNSLKDLNKLIDMSGDEE